MNLFRRAVVCIVFAVSGCSDNEMVKYSEATDGESAADVGLAFPMSGFPCRSALDCTLAKPDEVGIRKYEEFQFRWLCQANRCELATACENDGGEMNCKRIVGARCSRESETFHVDGARDSKPITMCSTNMCVSSKKCTCVGFSERVIVSLGSENEPPQGVRYRYCAGHCWYSPDYMAVVLGFAEPNETPPVEGSTPCTPGAITILEEPATPAANATQ